MNGFSGLVVVAMGFATAVGGTLGWTSGVMEGTLEAGVQAVGPLKFVVTPTGELPSTFTFTSSMAIFTAVTATDLCAIECTGCTAATTLACTATTMELVCDVTGSAGAPGTTTITCTAAAAARANVLFAVNPAMGDVTFQAVSALDTASASATNEGYTTVGSTLGWTSGVMEGALEAGVQAVGPLKFVVTPTGALPTSFTFTSPKAIFTAVTATDLCAIECTGCTAATTLACTATTMELVCDVTGSAGAPGTTTITCTAAAAASANVLFAVNPAMGDVTFQAVSALDTVSFSPTNVGYTTGEATKPAAASKASGLVWHMSILMMVCELIIA